MSYTGSVLRFTKLFSRVLPVFFFVAIFFFTSNTIPEPDTYYHLKLGEIISQQGIIYHDLLTQAAPHREWLPFEWSFQILLYQFKHLFGLANLRFFIGIFATAQVIFLYLFIRKIFRLSLSHSLLVSLAYAFLQYTSFTPRPQVVADLFFLSALLVILLYMFRGKNILFLFIPLTYLWSTFHLTVFLSPVVLGLYATYSFLLAYLKKDASWKKKGYTLSLFTLISCGTSLLPPTGIIQYKHLLLALEQQKLFSSIHEIKPLFFYLPDFLVYIGIILFVFIFGLWTFIRLGQGKRSEYLLLLPLSTFVILGITALRNSTFGHMTLLLFLSYCLSTLEKGMSPAKKGVLVGGMTLFTLFSFVTLHLRLKNAPSHLPNQAVEFLTTHKIYGNMFNDRTHGGYLSYRLYPEYLVFIDGRADVSYCCEMPDYIQLVDASNTSDISFRTLLFSTFDTYAIDFVIASYRNNTLGNAILLALKNNPQWSLVFWDDFEAIFVKKNEKNQSLWAEQGSEFATPFDKKPYKEDRQNEATKEYITMNTRYPSALSNNIIGYILFENNHIEEARLHFETAIRLDPELYFSYSNLALIAMKEKNYQKAIEILTHAPATGPQKREKSQFLGQAYLRMGNKDKAREIWQDAVSNSTTDEDRQIFLNLLQKI